MNVVHFYHENQEYQIERDILDKYTTYFSTQNITFDYFPHVDDFDFTILLKKNISNAFEFK